MRLNKRQVEKLNELITSVQDYHSALEEWGDEGYYADDADRVLADTEHFVYELGKINKKVFSS